MAVSLGAALWIGKPWAANWPPEFRRVTIPGTHISVEMPDTFGPPESKTSTDGVTVHSYGDLLRDRLGVEAVVAPLEEAIDEDDIPEAVERLKKEFAGKSLQQMPLIGEVSDGRLGGQPAMRAEYGAKHAHATGWASVFGNHELMIRVYTLDGLPDSWHRVGDRIANSVRLEP